MKEGQMGKRKKKILEKSAAEYERRYRRALSALAGAASGIAISGDIIGLRWMIQSVHGILGEALKLMPKTRQN
jgi:hypothetical protein